MNVFGSNTPPKGLSLRLFRVWNKTRNVTPPPPVIRPYNNQFISEFVRYAPYWLIQSPTVKSYLGELPILVFSRNRVQCSTDRHKIRLLKLVFHTRNVPNWYNNHFYRWCGASGYNDYTLYNCLAFLIHCLSVQWLVYISKCQPRWFPYTIMESIWCLYGICPKSVKKDFFYTLRFVCWMFVNLCLSSSQVRLRCRYWTTAVKPSTSGSKRTTRGNTSSRRVGRLPTYQNW